ncbi:MAG: hypothetical protein FWD01_00400 [Defluviitaleaceae bacterium]|nr:hypothetical protein [Defluviitaleaceae bacterium]
MNLETKIAVAEAVWDCILPHIPNIWHEFKPFPFILHDKESQVGVGENFPKRFSLVRKNIWAAKGRDENIYGNTSIMYHNQLMAAWRTDSWSENPDLSKAAANVVHEMFHCHQKTLSFPYANEMLLPDYPHNPRSVSLVLAENRLLIEIVEMLKENNAEKIRGLLGKIRAIRKEQEKEVGFESMQYDKMSEINEGTATYAEIRTESILSGKPSQDIINITSLLKRDVSLLTKYRYRSYAVGAVLCLAYDILMPNWQSKWQSSKESIFDWTAAELDIKPIESDICEDDLILADNLLSEFRAEKEKKISEFMAQELEIFEKDIQLQGFNPMAIITFNNHCLHISGCSLNINGKSFSTEHPCVMEYGNNIFDIKRIYVPLGTFKK